MLTWEEFRRERPDLAEAGRGLFYQFGVGLTFLATVRPNGGPRLHPMCPLITERGLYAFIVPGPKRDDLVRDGRYAMHGFPPANNEDAIYLTGRAKRREDPDLWRSLTNLFYEERGTETIPPQHDEGMLFEFCIGRCLLTRTTGHGDWNPQHTIWKAK